MQLTSGNWHATPLDLHAADLEKESRNLNHRSCVGGKTRRFFCSLSVVRIARSGHGRLIHRAHNAADSDRAGGRGGGDATRRTAGQWPTTENSNSNRAVKHSPGHACLPHSFGMHPRNVYARFQHLRQRRDTLDRCNRNLLAVRAIRS